MASVGIIVLLCFLQQTHCSDVRLGVSLPLDGEYPFSLENTMPGIDLALAYVNGNSYILPSHRLKVDIRDSKCSATEAPVQAVEFYCGGEVHGFIGPACDYAVAPVARYSPRWGMPVITAGAMAEAFQDKTEYKLLTRVMGSYSKLGEFFVTVMKHFNWTQVGFIYQKGDRGQGQSDCYLKIHALHSAMKREHLNPWYVNFDANDNIDNILNQVRSNARVLVMCAEADHIRDIMIRAHDLLTMEEYVFFNIAPFESDPDRRQWHRMEDTAENNENARQAYEGLMTVTLRSPTSVEYKRFSEEVNRLGLAMYMNHTSSGQVNNFVGAFHDAIILYALALHETIEAGENITDGEAITRRMWNRTFEGIKGTVSIDSNGDRNMDYSLLDMNPQTEKFEVVGNYYGNQKMYIHFEGKQIHWAGGMTEPPPDAPLCGFEGDKCPSEGLQTEEGPESSTLNVLTRVTHEQEENNDVPTMQPGRSEVDDVIGSEDNQPPKRKLTPDDLLPLQYQVLLQKSEKLIAETAYYKLMNRKLRKQLNV